MKQIKFFILTCCLAFAAGAQAQTNYDVWCNGERFTSEHLTVTCGEGTAVYDPATSTLTLTNVTISTGCAIPDDIVTTYCESGIFTLVNLNVVLIGDNIIEDTGGTGIDTYGITLDWDIIEYDIHLSGSGTLTITETAQWDGYGIYVTGSLVIDGVTLYFNTSRASMSVGVAATIKNSVIIIANSTSEGYGIFLSDVAGDILIDGSVIIGHVQPISNFVKINYVLANNGMIITYDPEAAPFTEGTVESILSDPEDVAVWAVSESSDFVSIPGVTVIPIDGGQGGAGGLKIPLLATFIPVTGITGVPTEATIGTPLELTGTVEPEDATNQTIVWSVQSAGTTGATISGNMLNTTDIGTVIVMATIANGKAIDTNYTQPFTITVSAKVGIEQFMSYKLQVYPNPTNGELRIDNGELKIDNAEIFDIYGKMQNTEIRSRKGNTIVMDISKLASGVYFLRIRTEIGDVVRKVVKE